MTHITARSPIIHRLKAIIRVPLQFTIGSLFSFSPTKNAKNETPVRHSVERRVQVIPGCQAAKSPVHRTLQCVSLLLLSFPLKHGGGTPPCVCVPVIQRLSDVTAATNESVKAETISGPWRDESAHLGLCSDPALIARLPPLRLVDLLSAGARVAPALRPGPNTAFRGPACRRQTARPPPALPRPAFRSAGCQAASNPLGSCG